VVDVVNTPHVKVLTVIMCVHCKQFYAGTDESGKQEMLRHLRLAHEVNSSSESVIAELEGIP
jgi:hypothetical protein